MLSLWCSAAEHFKLLSNAAFASLHRNNLFGSNHLCKYLSSSPKIAETFYYRSTFLCNKNPKSPEKYYYRSNKRTEANKRTERKIHFQK